MMTVPIAPNSRPAFLNATGMARMPVPSELFSRWISEPVVLFGLSICRCSNGLYSASEMICDSASLVLKGEDRMNGRAIDTID